MPIDDKTRSETILANMDNLLALAIEAVDQAKVGAPRPDDLRSILYRLLLTAQSLQAQLRSIESERPDIQSQT